MLPCSDPERPGRIENRGSVHSRDALLDAVWGYDAMPTTRTVDVHIAWLRQKLEDNSKRPRFIQTVHGLGYKFVADQITNIATAR